MSLVIKLLQRSFRLALESIDNDTNTDIQRLINQFYTISKLTGVKSMANPFPGMNPY